MIEIKHLKKEYPGVTPIKDLSAVVNEGDVISIIGPSGTGKSTLIRMINMLEKPTAGEIFADGEDITTKSDSELSKYRENIGMVFQHFNLFNHMTVIENVCYAPIHIKKTDPSKAYERGMELLREVGLAQFALSYPEDLSGGQKQRAAIVRTLAMEPSVILLDEPTSALDPTMVGEVESVIKGLAKKGYTMLIVTHDMSFAENVSSLVWFLEEGGVYESGSPNDIFQNPKKEKTKAFIRRLKDFHCSINSFDYDFPSLYSSLDKFLYKNEVPIEEGKKVRAIFEELCFGILVPKLKEQSSIDINVSYSAADKSTSLVAKWSELYADFDSEENAIQMSIIKHYAEEFSAGESECKIVIK